MEDSEDVLTINKAYAASYARKKRAEELSRLREKYGDEAESESSTSEEEDDLAEGVTTQVERDFLRTLSLIKSRDPQIYDKETNFYSSTGHGVPKETKGKPMYLRDYERKRLLERGSMAEASDSESESERLTAQQPTYTEEQQQLKASFQRAAEEELGSGDNVLTVRRKTQEEEDAEERAYAEWLKGQKSSVASTSCKEMEALRRYWSDPTLDPDELFLRDYILNRGYLDKEAERIPRYEELVGEEEEEEEDEEAVKKQEEFEKKYNFRFEEPGSDLIVNYPRTVAGSVRREDDKRKTKRKERQERKDQEKERKKQELKRLKNLKRKEILDKLERLKEITGDSISFEVEDLERDFDPTQYDQAMSRAFGEQYYEQGEDEGKPEFSDSGEENWDDWQPEKAGEEEAHCEDPDFNMDADYVPEAPQTMLRKQRRKASHFGSAVTRSKPTFDPNEKTFEEYFTEYYKLDYEDLVGDLPCRFKYRSVVPNDYGLTTGEVLSCEDKELNQWVSVKKSVQYRTEEEEKKDQKKYRKKARDRTKKLRILHSLQAAQEEGRDRQTKGHVQKMRRQKKLVKKLRLRKAGGLKGTLSSSRLLSYGLGRRK